MRRRTLAALCAASLAGAFAWACAGSNFTSTSPQKKATDDNGKKDAGDGDGADSDAGGPDSGNDGGKDEARLGNKVPGGTDSGTDAGGADAGTDQANGGGNGEIVISNGELKCDKGQQGLLGKLFQLPPETPALPNLDAMQPLGQVDALTLDVPARKWEQGFPGIPNLYEWFALQFFAELTAPEDGDYLFQTTSDDGSKVYIDKNLVLSNDGVHAPATKASGPVKLKKGAHELKVEWFQGPKVQIALQVYWKRPSAGGFEIIPAQLMKHGKDCNLQTVGHFP